MHGSPDDGADLRRLDEESVVPVTGLDDRQARARAGRRHLLGEPHRVEAVGRDARDVELAGVRRQRPAQPAPAPRFSRTPSATPTAPPAPGRDSTEVLTDWGVDPGRVDKLREAGVVHQA